MTWVAIGAALITTAGTVGSTMAAKGQGGAQLMPGAQPQPEKPAAPYEPTAAKAQTLPAPGAAAQLPPPAAGMPGQLPPQMDMEQLKKMYGLM